MTRIAASGLFAALATAALATVVLATPAFAEDRYCARLGPDDHYSSKGVPLNTVGAIIQQDRANYHKFGRRDPEDEFDPIFSNKISRDALNSRVDDNALSPAERREIINGSPIVCVTIDGDTAYITSIR